MDMTLTDMIRMGMTMIMPIRLGLRTISMTRSSNSIPGNLEFGCSSSRKFYFSAGCFAHTHCIAVFIPKSSPSQASF
jgi:G:T-mismatch repair DNA endonuclease (very short patch repair protein)